INFALFPTELNNPSSAYRTHLLSTSINRSLRAAFTQNRKARFLGVWPFVTERVLFSGAALPMSVLKEAAWEAANWQTNLAESFPMLGTSSRDEDDAGSKYFLASPNCVPAAVPPNKVLHSPCFERRSAAKNSVCLILFHLVSLKFSSSQLTPYIYRLRHLYSRDDVSSFDTADQSVWSVNLFRV